MAVTYVLLVVVTGSAAFLLRLFVQGGLLQETRIDSLAPMTAMMLWTVPAVISAVNGGLIGLLLFGAFAAAIARLLKQLSGDDLQNDGANAQRGLFALMPDLASADSRHHAARLAHLTGVVFLAYLGIAAELVGNQAFAIACIASSGFVSAWILSRRHTSKPRARQAAWSGIVIHAVLAITASFCLLLSLHRRSAVPIHGASAAGRQNYPSHAGRFSSIILIHKSRVPVLVIPRKTNSHFGPSRNLSKVMIIPFSGEYWFFRRPLRRPAPDSVRAEGDPTIFRINVRGLGALQMQALQRLGQRISLRCCRSISVVLHAADEQPDTVRIELILLDSLRRVHNSQTLGEQSVASPGISSPPAPAGVLNRTLHFEMPQHSEIRAFDALELWFHLESPRAGQSAMVSIERFELIP